MKNLIKKSIVLVVLFTALLGNANEISSLRSLNDEKTTMLTLLNVDKGDQLVLKDIHGKILYKEKIQVSGEFVKGFDFTSLPDGNYYFKLDTDLEIKKIPFMIKNNRLEYKKENESVLKKLSNISEKKNTTKPIKRSPKIESEVEKSVLMVKGRYFTEYYNQTKK